MTIFKKTITDDELRSLAKSTNEDVRNEAREELKLRKRMETKAFSKRSAR
jgi:hypothetical protein